MKMNGKVRRKSGSFWRGMASAEVVIPILNPCGGAAQMGTQQVMNVILWISMVIGYYE